MKNTSKLACLFSLGLLSGLCLLASFNITNGAGVEIRGISMDTQHKARLKQLILWDGNDNNAAWMQSTTGTAVSLDISNGLIVGNEKTSFNYSNGEFGNEGTMVKLVVVGGGENNKIGDGSDQSGIAGGSGNNVYGDNAAIGGGDGNKVRENAVVAGGNGNKGNPDGVVLGGYNNESEGVVLGGKGNIVGKRGVAMGVSAKGGSGSFVWNDGVNINLEAGDNSALIGASNGVLIGTYIPKDNVSLVVNGAIKLNSYDSEKVNAGEIRHQSGCLYAYDGIDWHALGKSTEENCTQVKLGTKNKGVAVTCKFGRILLQEGDEVTGYTDLYADSCNSITVTCKNVNGTGKLDNNNTSYDKLYPQCFTKTQNPYVTN